MTEDVWGFNDWYGFVLTRNNSKQTVIQTLYLNKRGVEVSYPFTYYSRTMTIKVPANSAHLILFKRLAEDASFIMTADAA